VESILGFRRGFFGLVAEGWTIEETTGKTARGPIPNDAKEVEYIVGSLDLAGGRFQPAGRHLFLLGRPDGAAPVDG
jgi:hypothetical protein